MSKIYCIYCYVNVVSHILTTLAHTAFFQESKKFFFCLILDGFHFSSDSCLRCWVGVDGSNLTVCEKTSCVSLYYLSERLGNAGITLCLGFTQNCRSFLKRCTFFKHELWIYCVKNVERGGHTHTKHLCINFNIISIHLRMFCK